MPALLACLLLAGGCDSADVSSVAGSYVFERDGTNWSLAQ
jgi:hypothetical protein